MEITQKLVFICTMVLTMLGLHMQIVYGLPNAVAEDSGFDSVLAEIHDVAVVNITLSEDQIYESEKVNMEVVVRNEGDFTEKFNVTIYANRTSEFTVVDTYLVTSLGSLDQITIPFVWDTLAVNLGNYTITAEASVVDGEMDTTDNTRTSGTIWVKADNTAPVIGVPVQNPSSDEVWQYVDVRVSVNVSDLGSGVLRVILSWRVDNETMWWNRTMIHLIGDVYQGDIPSYSAGKYISYKLVAYDRTGNQASRDCGGRYYEYCVIPEFPSVSSLLVLMILTVPTILIARKVREKS